MTTFEWKPIETEMPEQGLFVMGWSSIRAQTISHVFWDKSAIDSADYYWGAYSIAGRIIQEETGDLFEFKKGEITHWMPIPEPPK